VARLAAKQQTGVVLLFHYITANCPSMARLRNAARATFGTSGFCKREGLHLTKIKFEKKTPSLHHSPKTKHLF